MNRSQIDKKINDTFGENSPIVTKIRNKELMTETIDYVDSQIEQENLEIKQDINTLKSDVNKNTNDLLSVDTKIEELTSTVQGSQGGIRKVYSSEAAMNADVSPKDDNGVSLTNGQLVSIVNETTPSENAIYKWKNPGWEKAGELGDLSSYAKNGGSEKTLKDLDDEIVQLAGASTPVQVNVGANDALNDVHNSITYNNNILTFKSTGFSLFINGKTYHFSGSEDKIFLIVTNKVRTFIYIDSDKIQPGSGSTTDYSTEGLFIVSENSYTNLPNYHLLIGFYQNEPIPVGLLANVFLKLRIMQENSYDFHMTYVDATVATPVIIDETAGNITFPAGFRAFVDGETTPIIAEQVISMVPVSFPGGTPYASSLGYLFIHATTGKFATFIGVTQRKYHGTGG